MSQSTMTYVLSHVRASIPTDLLNLAFKPRIFNTTIEQRIMSQVIDAILLDINLVGGKQRDIIIKSQWLMDLKPADTYSVQGQAIQGGYYLIPPEAREYQNISSVISINNNIGSSMNGVGGSIDGRSFGNTATGMLSQMLNTRTFAQYPVMPELSLEGTNIIRFFPELITDGVVVSVLLEYDSEFTNMNKSGIFAMRKFCLCAVKRFIANTLMVGIDETQVVAGMEIGVIKRLVDKYEEDAAEYDKLLRELKGSMNFDSRRLSKMIYYSL